MRSIWKVASVSGAFGASIAAFFFIFFMIVNRMSASSSLNGLRAIGQDVVIFVWPASFLLMATEGAGLASTIGVVTIAILANFVIYFLLAMIAAVVWKWLFPLIHS